jgi:hypothetical protein
LILKIQSGQKKESHPIKTAKTKRSKSKLRCFNREDVQIIKVM